jgi:hypothetical protein
LPDDEPEQRALVGLDRRDADPAIADLNAACSREVLQPAVCGRNTSAVRPPA